MRLTIRPAVLGVIGLLGVADAGISVTSPCPRFVDSSECPTPPISLSQNIDINTPISKAGDSKSLPLCRHNTPWTSPVASWTAGQNVTINFNIEQGTLGGGHCQFSVSYGGDFAVVYEELEYCFIKDPSNPNPSELIDSYTFKLPENLPATDHAVFAWTWVSAHDDTAFYMNCADVSITNSTDSTSYTNKNMTILNYNGYPTVPSFGSTYTAGLSYYQGAEDITVGPSVNDAAHSIDFEAASFLKREKKHKSENSSSTADDDNDTGDSNTETEAGSDLYVDGDDDKCEDDMSYDDDDPSSSEVSGLEPGGLESNSSLDDTDDDNFIDDGKCDDSLSEIDTSESDLSEESSSTSEIVDISSQNSESESELSESPTEGSSSSDYFTSTSSTSSSEPSPSSSSYFAGPIMNSNEPNLMCTTSVDYHGSDIYYSGVYALGGFDYVSMYSDMLILDSSGSLGYVTETITSDMLVTASDSAGESENKSGNESENDSESESSTSTSFGSADYGLDSNGSSYLMFEFSMPASSTNSLQPSSTPPTNTQDQANIIDNSLYLGAGIE
ncbi:hypothetical protein BX070DRAFT_233445 [Coemansia spiralis]|nr:hypothetical protein BX070DRAFT_233445 [Coemansia spiralis]